MVIHPLLRLWQKAIVTPFYNGPTEEIHGNWRIKYQSKIETQVFRIRDVEYATVISVAKFRNALLWFVQLCTACLLGSLDSTNARLTSESCRFNHNCYDSYTVQY